MTATDPLLTGPKAAARAGVAAATWRSYVSRGYAPQPDDPDNDQPPNRRNPRWLTSTVDHFTANRLGQGARTDREKEG
jgi:hypothetical protein